MTVQAHAADGPFQILVVVPVLTYLGWVLIAGLFLGSDQTSPAAAGRRACIDRLHSTTIAIAACVLAAAIHLAVIPTHLTDGPAPILFFAVVAIVQAWLAIALARSGRRRIWQLCLGFNAVVSAVWLASRTVGLPVPGEPGEIAAVGALDLTAVGAQVIAMTTATLWLAAHPRGRAVAAPPDLARCGPR